MGQVCRLAELQTGRSMANCAVWITGRPTLPSGLPGDRQCCMGFMEADCAVLITGRPTVLFECRSWWSCKCACRKLADSGYLRSVAGLTGRGWAIITLTGHIQLQRTAMSVVPAQGAWQVFAWFCSHLSRYFHACIEHYQLVWKCCDDGRSYRVFRLLTA